MESFFRRVDVREFIFDSVRFGKLFLLVKVVRGGLGLTFFMVVFIFEFEDLFGLVGRV